MLRVSRSFARFLAALAGAALLLLTLAAPAQAHRLNESYLYFDVLPNDLEGRLEVRVPDVNEVLDLAIPEAEPEAIAVIEANLSTIQQYASEHVTISDDTSEWPMEFTDFSYLDTENGAFIQLHFDVDPATDEPKEWNVELDVFFDELPDNRAFVLIGHQWDAGVFSNESDEFALFSPGSTEQTIQLEGGSWWRGFKQTVKLGIDHIEIGTDHILFILVLLLPAVLTARGNEWHPTEQFGSSFWRVAKIATMFTIAHSITLTLGGLGLVNLPAKPVEALIALSIVAAAAHNLRPVLQNREWLIAFVFGLVHGLGFAGLLSDLGLDRTRRFSSLLGFNVGVEIGQIAIILMVFPILFLLRRTRLYSWILRLGSIAMAIVACLWMIERVFETEVSILSFVDRALMFPRVLIPLAVAAVFAFWFRSFEAGKDRLLPTVNDLANPEEVIKVDAPVSAGVR